MSDDILDDPPALPSKNPRRAHSMNMQRLSGSHEPKSTGGGSKLSDIGQTLRKNLNKLKASVLFLRFFPSHPLPGVAERTPLTSGAQDNVKEGVADLKGKGSNESEWPEVGPVDTKITYQVRARRPDLWRPCV